MPTQSPGLRRTALAGVVGPGAFIGAWALGPSFTSAEYSSLDDAISRLAAVGAGGSRPLMAAGFVVFGLSLPVYAVAVRGAIGGPAWFSAAMTGVATLGVAATPLDRSSTIDGWHAAVAGFGYLTLVAIPLLAARPLWRRGRRGLARFGVAAGAVSAISLLLTAFDLPTGLFQRIGLTAADVWIATSALAISSKGLRSLPG